MPCEDYFLEKEKTKKLLVQEKHWLAYKSNQKDFELSAVYDCLSTCLYCIRMEFDTTILNFDTKNINFHIYFY